MTVDPRLEELAQRSPNFGFLLAHEAVLVAALLVAALPGRGGQR